MTEDRTYTRQDDIRIAEFCGWKRIPAVDEWRDNRHYLAPEYWVKPTGVHLQGPPTYLTYPTPALDYEVLEAVRGKAEWHTGDASTKFYTFSHKLWGAWYDLAGRPGLGSCASDLEFVLRYYQPGDYARAVLTVLEGGDNVKRD